MFDGPTPDPPTSRPDPELALRLPADAYYHLVRTLRLTLPPPPTKAGVSDNPEALLRRDHAAIARVAALVPANAAEADLAAMFVAASEQWKDCLHLAQLPETAPEWALKCRAQAIGMMRQAQSALRLLLRMQAARGRREADSTACNSAAWTEHCAIALMAETLSGHPANSGDFAGTPPAAPTPAARRRPGLPHAPIRPHQQSPLPAKAGIQPSSIRAAQWPPAFAGKICRGGAIHADAPTGSAQPCLKYDPTPRLTAE